MAMERTRQRLCVRLVGATGLRNPASSACVNNESTRIASRLTHGRVAWLCASTMSPQNNRMAERMRGKRNGAASLFSLQDPLPLFHARHIREPHLPGVAAVTDAVASRCVASHWANEKAWIRWSLPL